MTNEATGLKATLFSLAGFTLWTVCDTAMKLATEYHLPTAEILAGYGALSSLMLLLFLALSGRLGRLRPKHPVPVALRGLLSVGVSA